MYLKQRQRVLTGIMYVINWIIFAFSYLDITQNTSVANTKIEKHVLKIDISSESPKYFKPGLQYYGKVNSIHAAC